MQQSCGPDHPLRRLFAGMVEHVFQVDLGTCDPDVTGYLSDLLVDFIHVERIYRLRNVDGQVIREVSRMQADACLGPDVTDLRRDLVIHRHIGDFTLFWAGLFPESLVKRSSGADRLREYVLQGKRSYVIASRLCTPDEKPPAALLRSLGERFEFCVHGLNRVRAGLERLSADTPN